MMWAKTDRDGNQLQVGEIGVNELEHMALSRRYEAVYEVFRRLPEEKRGQIHSQYVFHAVLAGGVERIRKLASACAEESMIKEIEFVDAVALTLVRRYEASGAASQVFFESILMWSDQLAALNYLEEAMGYLQGAIGLGIGRHPDLHVRVLLAKASILGTLGRWNEAQSLLISLAEQPYLIPDRNVIPEVIFHLCKASLRTGNPSYYRKLLFRGLKYFYTDIDKRGLFVDQICRTFRHSYLVLLNGKIRFTDRFLFFVHWLYFRTRNLAPVRLLQISKFLKFVLLGYIYFLRYQWRHGVADSGVPRRERKNILITRAMGGMGDLLMMSPGFHALKQKYPHEEIHLAIPRRYFSLFEQNPDLKLMDIEHDVIDCGAYKKWFNFTDCPAARKESRTAPEVKKSRIEIFARALQLNLMATRRMDHRPRYFVSQQERQFQLGFWQEQGLDGKTVVGIQLRAGESYRDYPRMEEVVDAVSQDRYVLVFDGERINGLDGARILKIEAMPLRQVFALASGCDAIVAPDSLFVHLAAALDIPCVALYGPIDGKVRTDQYPKCRFLDAGEQLQCVPCWRNEKTLCKLTSMHDSICMNHIPVWRVLAALDEVLHNGEA